MHSPPACILSGHAGVSLQLTQQGIQQGGSCENHLCGREDNALPCGWDALAATPVLAARPKNATLPVLERQAEVLLALLEECCGLLPVWMRGQAAGNAADAEVAQVLSFEPAHGPFTVLTLNKLMPFGSVFVGVA